MDSKLRNRSIRAVQRFLERREYEVMDTWEHQDFCGVVAKDSDDALVFAQVLCKLADDEGFPKESGVDRGELEVLASDWLRARNKDSWETPVRFDVVSILVLNEDRAFLRHHINALSQAPC